MANVYPIIIFNDSDLMFEPPCLNSVLEETLIVELKTYLTLLYSHIYYRVLV